VAATDLEMSSTEFTSVLAVIPVQRPPVQIIPLETLKSPRLEIAKRAVIITIRERAAPVRGNWDQLPRKQGVLGLFPDVKAPQSISL
jgi:hypothetical protein